MTEQEKEKLTAAYSERNRMAVAICRMALSRGWQAGIRIDTSPEHAHWDLAWRNVVVVVLPSGQELAWHLSPDELSLTKDLPMVHKPWDGTFLARDPNWPDLIPLGAPQ